MLGDRGRPTADRRFDEVVRRFDDLRMHLGSRIQANRNWIIAFFLIVASLIGSVYSHLQTVNDRLFENTQPVEQVAPQSQVQVEHLFSAGHS